MTPSAVPPIGQRLREARQRQGISIRGLARTVEVSSSLISQIETGRSSPSVSTLYALTNALGISIEDVFGDRDEAAIRRRAAAMPAPVGTDGSSRAVEVSGPATNRPTVTNSQRRRVGPVVRSAEREVLHLDSGVTWELLGQIPDSHVEFLRTTYPPGGTSSPNGVLMRHSGTEYGHVISGQLTLTLGFETYQLGPGDSVSFDSAVPHAYANHGTRPAVGVWFVLERTR